MQATAAEILCTACENCHSQLSDLNEHYKLDVKVEFLSNLVAEALVQEEVGEVTYKTAKPCGVSFFGEKKALRLNGLFLRKPGDRIDGLFLC